MAKITQLVCDMEHEDSDVATADMTRTFAIDGRTYELDLCASHDEFFTEAFSPFVAIARRSSLAPRPVAAPRPKSNESEAIRRWAVENGIEVNSRGRIPGAIIEQYQNRNAVPASNGGGTGGGRRGRSKASAQ